MFRILKNSLHFVKIPRRIFASGLFLLIQLAGAFSVLYGVSFWSVPVALVIGGVGAILAIERQTTEGDQDAPQSETERQIQGYIHEAIKRGANPFDNPAVPMTTKWLTYVSLYRQKAAK